MELKDIEANYIFTQKIEFGNDYVVMREPTMLEMKNAQNKDSEKALEELNKLFPLCIVESSFTEDGKPASGKSIADKLMKSSSTYLDLVNRWFEELPIAKKNKMKSAGK